MDYGAHGLVWLQTTATFTQPIIDSLYQSALALQRREIEAVTVLSKYKDRTVKTTQLAEAMGVQKNELPGLWFVYSRGEEIVKWPYEL